MLIYIENCKIDLSIPNIIKTFSNVQSALVKNQQKWLDPQPMTISLSIYIFDSLFAIYIYSKREREIIRKILNIEVISNIKLLIIYQ